MKKILIYDKFFFYGAGLKSIIKSNFPELDVFLVLSQNIFLDECSKNSFDIVIFDFINNNTLSFQKLKKIKKLQPKSKLFVFSENVSVDFKEQCSNCHVDFLLSKDCSEAYLLAALNLALFGNSHFTNNLRLNMPKRKVTSKSMAAEPVIKSTLSPREYEVAMLMIKGYSNTKISETLNIVSTTISTYKKRIFEKTKSSNIIDIAKILNVL